jgi:hypothetical protein
MRFEYATRDPDKVEAAKATLHEAAQRQGQSIIGFHTFQSDSYPALQGSPTAKGAMHTIVWGFTSQAELDDASPR